LKKTPFLCHTVGIEAFMEFRHQEHRIYAEDENGTLLAEVTFPASGNDAVCITHTFTAPSLRGQGVAGRLMEAVAAYAKEHNKKITAQCSYAAGWFERHSEYDDIMLK